MTAIKVEGLKKFYGPVHALDGLDLTVEPGTVFGFLGPNGAGKTTTIRILTGLARPTSGTAWVAGVEIGKGDIRRQIGYLPEEPAFYGWMTAREYLRDFVAPLFTLTANEARKRTDELLSLVGLTDAAKRRVGGYSRGMKQRLGMAQALMNKPPVLLLDEPVSALDPVGRREILELIERLRGETTVFMSTHILADVERVCDTVGIINKGKLIAQAGRDELQSRYATTTFEVHFDEREEAVKAWAAGLAGNGLVKGTTVEGVAVRLMVSDPARAKVEMPGIVAASGLAVQSYEWIRPSLEDIFMKLVEG